MTKLTLALALAIAFIATAPAFANPTQDARYSAGYQDMAYSKNGW